MASVKAGTAYIDVIPNMAEFGAAVGAGVKASMVTILPAMKQQFGSAMGSMMGGLSKLKSVALGFVGGGAIFAGLDMLAKKAVTFAQRIEKFSAVFGTSSADAAEFNAIAGITGQSADMAGKVLVRLSASFTKLNASTSGAAANLEFYGLTADLLSVKAHGLTGVMANLAEAYSNAADKQAFIASTLGPRGMTLAPVLDQWNELRAKVKAYGLDWNKVVPSEENMQSFAVMEQVTGAVITQIEGKLIPFVVKLGNALEKFLQDAANGRGVVRSFFADIFFGIGGVTGVLIKLFAIMQAGKIISAVTAIGTGVYRLVEAFSMLAGVGITQIFAQLELSLASFFGLETAGLGITTALAAEFAIIVGVVAAVAGAGYLIYKNWDKVGPVLGKVWSEFKEGAVAAWGIVKPVLTAIWGAVKQVWRALVGAFKGAWRALAPAIASLVKAFEPIWNALKPLLVATFFAPLIAAGIALVVGLKILAFFIRDVVAPVFRFLGGVIRDVVVPALEALIAVAKAALWPLTQVLKLIGVIGDTIEADMSAALADLRTEILGVGLAIRNGVDPVKMFALELAKLTVGYGAAGVPVEVLHALQTQLNKLYEDGYISAEAYTAITATLGKNSKQAAAEMTRMDKALEAVGDHEPEIGKLGKAFKALWPQLAIGAKNMRLLATATGQSAADLKAGLIAAMKSIATDGGLAFGEFIRTTNAAMKTWSEGLYGVFSAATSNFDNLQKKSHQTMQYILADAIREAKQQNQIALDIAAIATRAGTNTSAVLEYMSAHGITSVRELNAIVNSSPAAFKKFEEAIRSSSNSVREGSLPVLSTANQQFMDLINNSDVLARLKTVIRIDPSQLDAANGSLQRTLNILGGIGKGRLIISFTDEEGNLLPGGTGRPGEYAPRTRGSGRPAGGGPPSQLAEGGIVLPRPGGTLVNVGEAGAAEAVIPLSKRAGKGAPFTVDKIHVDNWEEGIMTIHGIARGVVAEETNYRDGIDRMGR